MSYKILSGTKKLARIIMSYCCDLKFSKSEFVKRKTIRYAFEFVVQADFNSISSTSKPFARIGSRKRARPFGTKTLFFSHRLRVLWSTECARWRFLHFVLSVCVSWTDWADRQRPPMGRKNKARAIFNDFLLHLREVKYWIWILKKKH